MELPKDLDERNVVDKLSDFFKLLIKKISDACKKK